MSINEYIKGQRHGKEAHKLERESMRDPFLSDAIDGFDIVSENHTERIGDMRRRILRKTNQTNRWMTYAGIAASLVFIISIGGYFLFNDSQDNYLAQSDFLHKNEAVAEQMAAESMAIIEEEEIDAKEKISYESVKPEQQSASKERREPVSRTSSAQYEVSNNKAIDVTEKEVVVEEIIIAPEMIIVVEDEKDLISYEDAKVSQETVKMPDSIDLQASRSKKLERGIAAALVFTPEPMIGWENYEKYLTDSLRASAIGDCAKLKGAVEVTFDIDENGFPLDFVISKSLCRDADAEAIRLIKDGSLWTNKGGYKSMKVVVKF